MPNDNKADETSSIGFVRITHDLTRPISGKQVLLVEDIVDTPQPISVAMTR